ncbi:MAG: hypothetical protein ACK5LC_07655 [Coprobacillaceae bacterium]
MQKSYKNNVQEFWNTFEKVEESFREMIDNNIDSETKLKKIGAVLKIFLQNPYFQVGYSSTLKKYELILTPEGNVLLLPLLYYWYNNAPTNVCKYWQFSYTKPAVLLKEDFILDMYGIKMIIKDTSIYITPDTDRQKFDLQIYNQDLLTLEDALRYNLVFIFLDTIFGELFVIQHIGAIDILSENRVEYGALVEVTKIKQWTHEVMVDEDWDIKEYPYKLYTGYQMTPREENCDLREDIFIGFTRVIRLLNDYLQEEYEDIENVQNDGVYYGYIFYDNTFLNSETVLQYRTDIEDDLIQLLETTGIATIIGGATGRENSYIDFIIFDKIEFLNIMKDYGKNKETLIYYTDFIKGSPIIDLQSEKDN